MNRCTRCRRSTLAGGAPPTPPRTGAGAAAVAVFCLLAGCGVDAGAPASGADAPVLVMAAADLQAAMPELVARYEAVSGQRATVMLGSTGNLATQIEQGAPADVFLAANESFVDRLAAGDLIEPGTRRVYAVGPLALLGSPGRPRPRSLAELVLPVYATIALAHPDHAPYGMAAREALQTAGLWETLRARLVYAENVAQALQFVRTGNADAGLVALALVHASPDAEFLRIDAALHAPLRQTAALLRRSHRRDAALAFLDLLTSVEGQAVLLRHGFEPPDER